MTFPIRKSARKLTGIVKITIPEVFPEMKPLGNIIIFTVFGFVKVVATAVCSICLFYDVLSKSGFTENVMK